MNRNNLTKFVIVIVVLVWAFIEMWPPVGPNVGDFFQQEAVGKFKDADYTNIVQALTKLQQESPRTPFRNLADAIGTNDITKYFPQPEYRAPNDNQDPSRYVLNRLQKASAGKIKLGIDLQGGTSFLVEMDTNSIATGTNSSLEKEAMTKAALSQAVEVLSRRVNKFGVAEPVIQPQGNNRILIQLPGLTDDERKEASNTISQVAFLEFKLVHPDSESLVLQQLGAPGYDFIPSPYTLGDGRKVPGYLVKRKAELTGDAITDARVDRNMAGQPEIRFQLNSEGAKIFGDVTRSNINHRLAIILDGKVESAPNIQSAIEGGSGVITGDYTVDAAQNLANVLQNPLKVPVHIIQQTSVDPTLGAATVQSGIRSAIIGTLLVAGFMAAYYLFAGLVADLALVTNIIILLGVMCMIPATFTLPGIAGIVLTIGMAVDANVLIFERIREEKNKGKSLRGALAAGYDRAFGTILDSHVTTLISSVILIYMGTGPIKGFGVTLTIGVAASLFTALVVTRLIFDFLIDRGIVKSLNMFHLIRATKLDFMKLAKPAFALSWTIILIGLAYGIFVRGNNMLGIDFKGGDNLTMSYAQKVDDGQLSAALKKINVSSEIQYQSELGGTNRWLQITSDYGTADKVLNTLTNSFPSAGFVSKGSEAVGATVSSEILQTAIVASLMSLLGILIYVAVRYEFAFAVGAVVAVIHDVLMTIGCYCLTGLFSHEGRQFNATMVAAVLTIIGFSINDTIVIFDRIREDLRMGVRGSFKDLINQALNQTLSRTIITSGTVFLATFSLYIFGGGAINDFAFTFLVGIITGTYSSIYIASALVLWWHKGARPRTSNAQMVAQSTVAAAKP